jgi:hypothetical protein
MFQTVEPYLLSTIHSCKYASEAWGVLNKMFEGRSKAQLSQLKAKLSSIAIAPNENVLTYYGRTMALWNDIRMFGDTSFNESDVVAFFLRGLRRRVEFKVICSTLMYDSDVSLAEALVKLRDAEDDHVEQEETEPVALRAQALGKSLFCNYCKGHVGHVIGDCPKVAEKEKRKKKKNHQKVEKAEALVGEACGLAGPSGLHATRAFKAGATWEEVEPL